MESGRLTRVTERAVPVYGEPVPLDLATRLAYTGDGRLQRTTWPDGSTQTLCYSDSASTAPCNNLTTHGTGRSSLPNIWRVSVHSSSGPSDPPLSYDRVDVDAVSYDMDNMLAGVRDPLGRESTIAVPTLGSTMWSTFAEAGRYTVSTEQEYDLFGRLKRMVGGSVEGGGPPTGPVVSFTYLPPGDQPGAGLLQQVDLGGVAQVSITRYDAAGNPERVETSYGGQSLTQYDELERPIRTLAAAGETDALGRVGSSSNRCASWPDDWPAGGVYSERGYDAAGHLVVERTCQDYVDPGTGQLASTPVWWRPPTPTMTATSSRTPTRPTSPSRAMLAPSTTRRSTSSTSPTTTRAGSGPAPCPTPRPPRSR